MTIKEIAKLCGVSESLVKEWISTIKKNGQDMTDHGQIMTVIEMKCLEAQKSKKPADFTLEETLAYFSGFLGGRPMGASRMRSRVSGGYIDPRKKGSIPALCKRCCTVFSGILRTLDNSSKVHPFASII